VSGQPAKYGSRPARIFGRAAAGVKFRRTLQILFAAGHEVVGVLDPGMIERHVVRHEVNQPEPSLLQRARSRDSLRVPPSAVDVVAGNATDRRCRRRNRQRVLELPPPL
jgi:hypothetical protein